MEVNVNRLIRVMRIMEFSKEYGATFGRSVAWLVRCQNLSTQYHSCNVGLLDCLVGTMSR